MTDAMNMKGFTEGNPCVVDKNALVAGDDLLEFTEDIPKAISEIEKAIAEGIITQETIDEKCRKMLAIKQWVGLDEYKLLPVENILKDLNYSEAELLQGKLVEATLTLHKTSGIYCHY